MVDYKKIVEELESGDKSVDGMYGMLKGVPFSFDDINDLSALINTVSETFDINDVDDISEQFIDIDFSKSEDVNKLISNFIVSSVMSLHNDNVLNDVRDVLLATSSLSSLSKVLVSAINKNLTVDRDNS